MGTISSNWQSRESGWKPHSETLAGMTRMEDGVER